MFGGPAPPDDRGMRPIKRGPAGTTIAATVIHFVVVALLTVLWFFVLLLIVAFSGLPADASARRFWDGAVWTGQTSPREARPSSASSDTTLTPAARNAAAVIPAPSRKVRVNEPS